MLYMNDYDLAYARARFTRSTTPNRLALAIVVDNLREWADDNSDGWAHWPKPCKAAEKAMGYIASRTSRINDGQERQDISHEEMLDAVRPIKAFLTRQSASAEAKERILRAVNS